MQALCILAPFWKGPSVAADVGAYLIPIGSIGRLVASLPKEHGSNNSEIEAWDHLSYGGGLLIVGGHL